MINLVADENVHQRIIEQLIQKGFQVIFIKSVNPGTTDLEIIEKYLGKNSLLITEDSDFGKMGFCL